MEFRRIKDVEFDEFYDLLEEAFPFVERKTKACLFLDVKNSNNFYPCFICDDDNNKIGLISYWNFGDFIFAEHLAIFKNLRNKTLGTQAFSEFLKSFDIPIIFEVEKPYDELSKRRIDFYKRIGIIFNDFSYFQPSYHGGDDCVPMLIASYPKPINKNDYNYYTKIIKKNVYNLNS